MKNWKQRFKYDPTVQLAKTNDIALKYSYELDIIGRTEIKLEDVWQSKAAQSILRKQKSNGSWKYKSSKSLTWTKASYDQYETFKQLAQLVEKYRFDKTHSGIKKAAEYFFKHQTEEGDIRGIYGTQYTPNYTSNVLELLIKAGYEDDKRVIKALDWLLNTRQDDGGWALAFRTKGHNLGAFSLDETIKADYSKPSSHVVTGVVLRPLVIHPKYCQLDKIKQASKLLADSLFENDHYPDRRTIDFWTRLIYPFVYTDIISALDSLSIAGGYVDHPKVQEVLNFLEAKQTEDGLFSLRVQKGKGQDLPLWIALAVCRIYKKLYS